MSKPSTAILRAGAARSNITTSRKDVAVNDPLYARALVLDDGAKQAVIVALDTTAIGGRAISRRMLDDVGEEFLPALRGRIETELGIPRCNVMVNASHTHPPGRLLCDDREQIERTFDAVRRAFESMVPVKAGAGSGREERLTANRTLKLKDGRAWTVRHSHPSPPDSEVAAVGSVDPEIGILRFDRLDGRPLAVVYNFACHLLFGDVSGAVTANIPGLASGLIEETLGGGVTALFLQGAGGDVIDICFKDFDRPRDIEPLGTMLGLSTLRALREISTGRASLNVLSRTARLPRRTDIPGRIKSLQSEQEKLLESLRSTSLNFDSFLPMYLKYALNPEYPLADSYRYLQAGAIGRDDFRAMDVFNRRNLDKYLKSIRAMERLSVIRDDLATLRKHMEINESSGSATITAEVMGLRVGDCVLITAPIELLTKIGLNIKKASPRAYTFVAGFTNGYMHYGPPSEAYGLGGYEATECLLAPEWQDIYEKTVEEVIRAL